MSAEVKKAWSGIDVTEYGPFKEVIQAQLISRIWTDESFKQEMLTNPKVVLEREVGITLPADMEIKALEEDPNVFYFVIPKTPADEAELLDRYEQNAGWWMLAHTWWRWISQIDILKADTFRKSLQVLIIGRIWSNESFRQEMLTNPKVALEREVGVTFPPGMHVKALEETSNFSYLVLPRNPTNQQLDDRLEQPSSWWATAHTWWSWLVWLRLHTPTTKVVKGLLG
jgi:hypothetical protein